MEMNGLRSAKTLRVGLELIIPKPIGSGPVAAARERPSPAARRAEPARREASAAARATAQSDRARTTLRVQPGDSLWSISRRLGVELQELCRWNGIGDPRHHKLLVGSQLVVYGERG
jgi:membrane-bound lytic murein transglycosylase D